LSGATAPPAPSTQKGRHPCLRPGCLARSLLTSSVSVSTIGSPESYCPVNPQTALTAFSKKFVPPVDRLQPAPPRSNNGANRSVDRFTLQELCLVEPKPPHPAFPPGDSPPKTSPDVFLFFYTFSTAAYLSLPKCFSHINLIASYSLFDCFLFFFFFSIS